MRRALASLALAAMVAGGLASVGASTAQAAPPVIAAIGDSYMAGVGAGSYADVDGCRQSARSYAADAARRTARTLADESCPGAQVPQVLDQATRIPADASWVLIQVGGNDIGFSSLAVSCLLPGSTSCAGAVAQAEQSLPALSAGLAAIAREARSRAPKARLVFAGYPSLLAAPDRCASGLVGSLLDPAEIAAINGLQSSLNATIRTAARASGSRYMDWPAVVSEHSLCSASPWFVTPFTGPAQDSLHPTARAYSAMGRQVASLVRR